MVVQSGTARKLIPSIPEKWRLTDKLERCVDKLNNKFEFFEDSDELEEFKNVVKLAFLKGRLRDTRIRGDVNNKLCQWSIKYAVDKYGVGIGTDFTDWFGYWDHKGYGIFYHFLKTEEDAQLEQTDVIKDIMLYTNYQDIITDAGIQENIQTYYEIEEVYFELVKRKKHLGKSLFKVYYYCIVAVIFDDWVDEEGYKATPEDLCTALEITAHMYKKLIRDIFQIKDTVESRPEMFCTPPELGTTESDGSTLAAEYVELTEGELRPPAPKASRVDLETEEFKLEKVQDLLRDFAKKLFKMKDLLQGTTLDSIVFLFYRYFNNRLLTNEEEILQIIYSSLLTFDGRKKDQFIRRFREELKKHEPSKLDVRESDDFIRCLEEYLTVYQVVKKRRHKRIEIRDSILDYKIGTKDSKLLKIEKSLLSLEKKFVGPLARKDVQTYFDNIATLINKNHPLNPKVILILCSIFNFSRLPSLKAQISPDILFTLLRFIINEFEKPKKRRQVKITLLERLVKAIIAYDQPACLYFMKHLIDANKINMKFVLFAENHLITPDFDLFSLAFFGKNSFSKIFKQQTLDNFTRASTSKSQISPSLSKKKLKNLQSDQNFVKFKGTSRREKKAMKTAGREKKSFEIISAAGNNGILQSDLWRRLDINSREGSRIATNLENKGLIRRSRELYEGRWTYRLYIETNQIKKVVDQKQEVNNTSFEIESENFKWHIEETYSSLIFLAKTFNPPQKAYSAISINGNEEFSEIARKNNWFGDGTVENPFIIKNADINAKDKEIGIKLENIDSRFIIINCSVRYAKEIGIFLSKVKNGIICENNLLRNKSFGIILLDSDSNTIIHNYIQYNLNGMNLVNSNKNIIGRNFVQDNREVGIYLDSSINNMIFENFTQNNGKSDIFLFESPKTKIVYPKTLND